MLNPDSDDDDKKNKKNYKDKRNVFRIDRGYLVNKIMKLAAPYYQMSDKETGLCKFK
jgi:hypothetical protein